MLAEFTFFEAINPLLPISRCAQDFSTHLRHVPSSPHPTLQFRLCIVYLEPLNHFGPVTPGPRPTYKVSALYFENCECMLN